MSRLIKVAKTKVVREGVKATPSSITKTTEYIGQFDGYHDRKYLRTIMASYDYYFASPPRSWYATSRKAMFRDKLRPGIEFDENGFGVTVYWEGEKSMPDL